MPFGRSPYGNLLGFTDDAQIMDEALFNHLKEGFNDEVETDYPNVIFTGEFYPEDSSSDQYHWPTTVEEAAKFWVVVIDYHW